MITWITIFVVCACIWYSTRLYHFSALSFYLLYFIYSSWILPANRFGIQGFWWPAINNDQLIATRGRMLDRFDSRFQWSHTIRTHMQTTAGGNQTVAYQIIFAKNQQHLSIEDKWYYNYMRAKYRYIHICHYFNFGR